MDLSEDDYSKEVYNFVELPQASIMPLTYQYEGSYLHWPHQNGVTTFPDNNMVNKETLQHHSPNIDIGGPPPYGTQCVPQQFTYAADSFTREQQFSLRSEVVPPVGLPPQVHFKNANSEGYATTDESPFCSPHLQVQPPLLRWDYDEGMGCHGGGSRLWSGRCVLCGGVVQGLDPHTEVSEFVTCIEHSCNRSFHVACLSACYPSKESMDGFGFVYRTDSERCALCHLFWEYREKTFDSNDFQRTSLSDWHFLLPTKVPPLFKQHLAQCATALAMMVPSPTEVKFVISPSPHWVIDLAAPRSIRKAFLRVRLQPFGFFEARLEAFSRRNAIASEPTTFCPSPGQFLPVARKIAKYQRTFSPVGEYPPQQPKQMVFLPPSVCKRPSKWRRHICFPLSAITVGLEAVAGQRCLSVALRHLMATSFPQIVPPVQSVAYAYSELGENCVGSNQKLYPSTQTFPGEHHNYLEGSSASGVDPTCPSMVGFGESFSLRFGRHACTNQGMKATNHGAVLAMQKHSGYHYYGQNGYAVKDVSGSGLPHSSTVDVENTPIVLPEDTMMPAGFQTSAFNEERLYSLADNAISMSTDSGLLDCDLDMPHDTLAHKRPLSDELPTLLRLRQSGSKSTLGTYNGAGTTAMALDVLTGTFNPREHQHSVGYDPTSIVFSGTEEMYPQVSPSQERYSPYSTPRETPSDLTESTKLYTASNMSTIDVIPSWGHYGQCQRGDVDLPRTSGDRRQSNTMSTTSPVPFVNFCDRRPDHPLYFLSHPFFWFQAACRYNTDSNKFTVPSSYMANEVHSECASSSSVHFQQDNIYEALLAGNNRSESTVPVLTNPNTGSNVAGSPPCLPVPFVDAGEANRSVSTADTIESLVSAADDVPHKPLLEKAYTSERNDPTRIDWASPPLRRTTSSNSVITTRPCTADVLFEVDDDSCENRTTVVNYCTTESVSSDVLPVGDVGMETEWNEHDEGMVFPHRDLAATPALLSKASRSQRSQPPLRRSARLQQISKNSIRQDSNIQEKSCIDVSRNIIVHLKTSPTVSSTSVLEVVDEPRSIDTYHDLIDEQTAVRTRETLRYVGRHPYATSWGECSPSMNCDFDDLYIFGDITPPCLVTKSTRTHEKKSNRRQQRKTNCTSRKKAPQRSARRHRCRNS